MFQKAKDSFPVMSSNPDQCIRGFGDICHTTQGVLVPMQTEGYLREVKWPLGFSLSQVRSLILPPKPSTDLREGKRDIRR